MFIYTLQTLHQLIQSDLKIKLLITIKQIIVQINADAVDTIFVSVKKIWPL